MKRIDYMAPLSRLWGPDGETHILVIEYYFNEHGDVVPFQIITEHDFFDVEWCKREQSLYWESVGSGLWKRPEGKAIHVPGRIYGDHRQYPIWWDRSRVQLGVSIHIDKLTGRRVTRYRRHGGRKGDIYRNWGGRNYRYPWVNRRIRRQDEWCWLNGWEPLLVPALLKGSAWDGKDFPGTRNPFELYDMCGCSPQSCQYCTVCDDHLPENSDNLCEHVYWCDDCGAWTGPGVCEGDGCKCWATACEGREDR